MSLTQRFISNSQFAVVGASTSRAKYGNKKESEIEGIRTVSSVDQLEDPQHTSVSIITPPNITLGVLKDCKRLGIDNVWLQPGAEDNSVLECAQELGLNVIAGGPCILVQGPSLLLHRDTL
ncbi:hypothetical protein [Absidia glauca]|uniref:CoA-binding domain-containing protein n=1 Tax=Absidia glauca TaxID=4829 RepID=A0A168QZU5_ABSGL|nr:hypothetical protein [Absidia glauca]